MIGSLHGRTFLRRLLACGCFALVACGPSLPKPYTSERDAASTAYSAGAYRDAATHWQRAEALAPNQREKDEARYRRAAALERAGDTAAAERLYAQIAESPSERAERASFARAELALGASESAHGFELLRQAVERFPNSGLASSASRRLLDRALAQGGSQAERALLQALLTRVEGSDLEDALLTRRARALERDGELQAAHEAWLSLARKHPYPLGAYWDEALRAAAELDVKARRPQEALDHLGELLAEREASRLSGSYERPAFAEARFRRAELYRDALNDAERARSEFRRVYDDHDTSLLRDDALFEIALIALSQRNQEAACENARLLQSEQPDSRFARCGHELCPPSPRSSRPCGAAQILRIEASRSREP